LPAFGAKPNVINFHRHQYQAANKNWAVGQDAQGVLYFGNDNGLLEFDGLRWQLHTPDGDKVVRAIAAGPGGQIYTGGYEEFGYWHTSPDGSLEYTSLSRLLPDSVMHNDDIWKIILMDNHVYFQSFKQVYVYDLKSGLLSVCRNAAGNVLFLHKVHSRLWVQVMGGALYELSGEDFVKIPGSDFFERTEVRIILPYKDQWLIGTSSKGIYLYDGRNFSLWDTDFCRESIPYELNNGIMGSNGNYFFGTILNGMYEVDAQGRIINHISVDDLLPNNTVLNIYEEQSGNIWLALDRGISYVQYIDRMDCYIRTKGDVGAVYASAIHGGNLYLGTNQGLFYLPVDDMATSAGLGKFHLVEGTQGQVWDLREKDGELLCGHNNGLKIIVNGKVTASVPNTSGVYRIQEAEGGDVLFLGTYTTAAIVRKDGQKWKQIPNSDLTQFVEPVYNIQQDHLGNVWLGHIKNGVYRCVFSQDMTSIKHLQNYVHPGAHLQMFRIGGRVVFAGNDSLFVYDDIKNKLEYHSGLARCFEGITNLRNIIPVSKTRFWAITDNCLYDMFYDGHESRINYRFDLGAGNFALVDNYENIVVLNDSLSLICLDNGFLLHTAGSGKASPPQLSKPTIRSVAAIDKRKQMEKAIGRNAPETKLPFEYNTLRFRFFARDMLSQKQYFQTRLEGVDEDWSAPGQLPEALYERLPEGRYTFTLRTTDAFGQCSGETTFTFTILPPWYLSSQAYAGYVILLLLLLYAGYKLWFRQMRNRQIMKVRMEEEQRLRRLNSELHAEIEHTSSELYAKTLFMIRNKNDWKTFLIHFEHYHKDFFENLVSRYPDLTSNDLKLCACLKLNLSSKDIAQMMGISLRGVENSRYRLRKKLHLDSNQNLNDFFMRL
jgi:ligand-binding sensor domain-containing protein/DNA-binding CsgD family transcriptional regulator